MNLDTDLQWAFWEGVLNNYKNMKLTCKAS